MSYYLRDVLKKYLPNFFGLLYTEPDWTKLTQKVNECQPIDSNSYMDSHLYEIIAGAEANDLAALAFLEYFDIVFREVCTLPEHCKKQLNDKAIILLNELTKNFKHYIGEFAILDSTIKSGMYELLQVEAPIGNGKSAEYLFKETKTGITYFVEVVNLQLNESHKNLKKIVRRKLVHKVNSKSKETSHEIMIVPVIWAKRAVLINLANVYNEQFKVKHTYEPFAFSIEPNSKTGIGEHRFWGITRLFS